jgi:hypothetical protein
VSSTVRFANSDAVRGTKFADGIAASPWPIELHSGDKPRVEWLLNDYYEVPYGCFVLERGEGLLVAGRCLSAEHEARDRLVFLLRSRNRSGGGDRSS